MANGTIRSLGFAAVAVGVCSLLPARASDNAPVIAIPGRPDVPVIIDGRNAAWGIVEGDWGLYRPGWVPPTVIKPLCCSGYRWRPVPHYFPGSGHMPAYGRREVDPTPSGPPKPAESYSETWNAKSENLPATIMPPTYDVPPVVVDPVWGGGRGPRPPRGPGRR